MPISSPSYQRLTMKYAVNTGVGLLSSICYQSVGGIQSSRVNLTQTFLWLKEGYFYTLIQKDSLLAYKQSPVKRILLYINASWNFCTLNGSGKGRQCEVSLKCQALAISPFSLWSSGYFQFFGGGVVTTCWTKKKTKTTLGRLWWISVFFDKLCEKKWK